GAPPSSSAVRTLAPTHAPSLPLLARPSSNSLLDRSGMGLIAVVEIAGSFAYFGVSANLITYLTGPLGHSNAAAAAAVNAWSGTACLMPLLGAFVADSWLGRYRSIILACTLYVLGYGMMTLSSRPSSLQVALFYASLYLIPLAQGADKPCGLAFAADQFDADHPKERASRSSLFNWWYFSMAIGISVAVAVVSYIQENVGWGIGFGMLCAIMLCAFAVFLSGTPTYRLYAPTPGAESPFAHVAAKSEEARGVLRLLPIWAACLAYGVAYAQIMTLFNKQGRTLDRRIFGGLELPPAALQTLGPASILLFVPIYDRLLVPALGRATGKPSGLTLLQRVGVGMVVSMSAVIVAALVEGRRLETAREHGLVDDAGATVPMSWAWLVPQYAMMGVADVLTVVGLQEFFYDQMPRELRSLGLALYFSVMGIGGFISSALISFIDRVTRSGGGDGWFADNLNRAHLDYFYWLLAGLSAAELGLFVWLASSYTYNNNHKRLQH
uniref:Major facilitator superfamily (MFS) profile domain-containing protein n=1 Tax=Aegilops tauschii subsp. strangulata TaxID=200361 RepID=A0A453DKV3_AEGTS